MWWLVTLQLLEAKGVDALHLAQHQNLMIWPVKMKKMAGSKLFLNENFHLKIQKFPQFFEIGLYSTNSPNNGFTCFFVQFAYTF